MRIPGIRIALQIFNTHSILQPNTDLMANRHLLQARLYEELGRIFHRQHVLFGDFFDSSDLKKCMPVSHIIKPRPVSAISRSQLYGLRVP